MESSAKGEIVLPTEQAEEILRFLTQCPYGQVHQLVGYLLTAGQHAALAARVNAEDE